MKKFLPFSLKFGLKWLILTLAVLLHICFYVSAFKTHSLDKFFLTVTQGQDFFQIPNAAYSFLRGGNLQGNVNGLKNPYIDCCRVNPNVYHPFFTLAVGIPLQFFKPWTAFNLWLFLHFAIDVFIVLFLISKFKKNRYLILALLIFLLNNFAYYEILSSQYHFLLNLFTFLFLYENYKNGDTARAGFYYFLSLFVKPIGLLWILPLIFYKQFKTLFIGLGLYILISLPFYLIPIGGYFFENILVTIEGTIPNDFNIIALLRAFGYDLKNAYYWEIFFMIAFLVLSLPKKVKLFTIIFFMVCFQLIFYGGSYPYHFSILGYLLPLGVILGAIELGLFEKIAIFFLTIPAPIAYLRFILGVSIQQLEVLTFVSWSVIPLLLLILTVYIKTVLKIKHSTGNS